jgi:hypothetical protein
MEAKIKECYLKFKKIYNQENYPEWFEYFNSYNKKKGYGDKGYIDYEDGHELGHYAILQNELPKKTKIILVGKNNSWFDESCMRSSLKIVRGLKDNIPSENHLINKKSLYSKKLNQIFNEPELKNLLMRHTLGMNRVWLQSGPEDSAIKYMKAPMSGTFIGSSLVDKCSQWTKEIIRIINPEILILFGNENDPNSAQRLFREDADELFAIKHCYHPCNRKEDGVNLVRNQIKSVLRKNELLQS